MHSGLLACLDSADLVAFWWYLSLVSPGGLELHLWSEASVAFLGLFLLLRCGEVFNLEWNHTTPHQTMVAGVSLSRDAKVVRDAGGLVLGCPPETSVMRTLAA